MVFVDVSRVSYINRISHFISFGKIVPNLKLLTLGTLKLQVLTLLIYFHDILDWLSNIWMVLGLAFDNALHASRKRLSINSKIIQRLKQVVLELNDSRVYLALLSLMFDELSCRIVLEVLLTLL